jgi:hypothetical protein
MKNYNDMTKKELIEVFKENTQKAHPWVKKIAYSGLIWQPKDKLIRFAKHAHTVKNPEGSYDISYTPKKKGSK